MDSFLVNQLGIASPPRWILSSLLIAGMMLVVIAGQQVMLTVTQWLVYPLVAILIFVSIYLIPEWNLSMAREWTPTGWALPTIWLTIPVPVFAFNHSPAISQFSVALERHYGAQANARASSILRDTAIMLVGFVMFFVFSCVLALTPAQLAEAKSQNLPVLSYPANAHASPFISYLGPVVAFVAIVSWFFGHCLGTAEGLRGMVVPDRERMPDRTLIKALSGPAIAAILYLMPMYAIHNVPALARCRGRASTVFVTVMGLIAISAIVFGLF